jgi:hypothetical protein
LAMISIPSLTSHPGTGLGNSLWPSRRRRLFCAASSSLEAIANAVLLDSHPFRSDRAVAHGSEDALKRDGCPQVLPVLGREIVERQSRVPILAQAVDRLLVFGREALDPGAERQLLASRAVATSGVHPRQTSRLCQAEGWERDEPRLSTADLSSPKRRSRNRRSTSERSVLSRRRYRLMLLSWARRRASVSSVMVLPYE